MKGRFLILALVLSLLLAPLSASALAASPGIWLMDAKAGKQSWAYYPFNPQQAWSGGKWSPAMTGTSAFNVTSGTSIVRKLIVKSTLPSNQTISLSVSGLPRGFAVKFLTPRTLTGASIKNGFGYASFFVSIPATANPGTYPYTVRATASGGQVSTISDAIVVSVNDPPAILNAVSNPGFESGLQGWQWDASNSLATVNLSTDAHSGNYSLHMANPFNYSDPMDGGPAGYVRFWQPINAHVGDNVTVTFWVKGNGLADALFDPGDPHGAQQASFQVTPQWAQRTVTYTIQDESHGCSAGMILWWNGDLYFDDFQVTVVHP